MLPLPGAARSRRGLRPLLAGCILAVLAQPSFRGAPAREPIGYHAAPPQTPADSTRSTRAGAYATEQATRGKELYALNCVSCHTAVSHTGPAFVDKWDGRTLWDLYQYLSESMPKSEPGSLTPNEYARLLSYMLQMNGAPAGPAELVPDSTALKQIRIDLKPR